LDFNPPYVQKPTYGTVQVKMHNSQAPLENDLQRKTTFYGHPIPSPNQSMQGISMARTEASQTYSFGSAHREAYTSSEPEKSFHMPVPELIVPLPEQGETRFPRQKPGRSSETKKGGRSRKKEE
jgi:hypothetical protein